MKTPISQDYDRFLGMSFGQMLDTLAREELQKEIFVFKNRRITYQAFHQEVRQMSKGLKSLGIKKGDRIAALLPNSPEFFVCQQASLYIGGVFIMLSTRYREFELTYMLKHSGAKCLFTIDRYMGTDFLQIIEKLKLEMPELKHVLVLGDETPPWTRGYKDFLDSGQHASDDLLEKDLPGPEDIASMLYTSGSTGTPKGVMMSHRAFIFDAVRVCERLRIVPEDVFLMIVPCSHTLCAFVQFTDALVGRVKIALMENFDAEEALRLWETERVSVVHGVPAMFQMMLNHPDFVKRDLSSSRAGYMGGAFCPEDVVRDVIRKMHLQISCTYGMSENGCCTINDFDDDETSKCTTVGRPIRGCEIKLTDDQRKEVPAGVVGEIAIRGPNLFSGYYKQPEITKASYDEEGFFYSGDLGRYLADGNLTIVGRKKEMIIRGGFNVYPVEVEEQLKEMGVIDNVAVIGLPDEVMGEKVVACIIPTPGKNVTAEEVIAFCKRRLANYKVPSEILFMEKFPTTTIGKTQKFKLQEMLVQPQKK